MLIADLHIHSSYSRATSRECDPEHLDFWGRRKGIQIIGSGDFTHPAWRKELQEKLEPAEDGLYTLRPDLRLQEGMAAPLFPSPRFVISGEISSIYKKNGKVRKVHNVILLPGLDEADSLARKLEMIGNIHSDGRPILGLDSRDLLEITLETCPEAIFIPAHIWTPHFSLFGAFSGFDTIEECFEDLTPYIHALETGLSSDPPMNWRCSALDGYQLVSNSDAHSPSKLGREANLLDIPFSYSALSDALQGKDPKGFVSTIEFFPEEGKYHLDGHRHCHLCLSPEETKELGGKCPVCGKKITIGVQHRVEELADRPEGFVLSGAHPFESLAPLPEVIGASTGLSANGVRVHRQYEKLLQTLGAEFSILREISIEDIQQAGGPCIAEGIRRLRAGNVKRMPGYDGEYGTIQLLDEAEVEYYNGQISLFSLSKVKHESPKKAASNKAKSSDTSIFTADQDIPLLTSMLNDQQQAAVTASETVVAVVAGPGTGKTKTLVSRIAYLIKEQQIKPAEITAVTFTNKAAAEMHTRLKQELSAPAAQKIVIGTFHSICLRLLAEWDKTVALADEHSQIQAASEVLEELDIKSSPAKLLREISNIKNGAPSKDTISESAYSLYNDKLHQWHRLDFDDLLLAVLDQWETHRQAVQAKRFTYLLVDEFQDINPLQQRLIQLWSQEGKSLFVIGDPDQSIYGFRGSDAACFQKLRNANPTLRQIHLQKNYRSTPEIIQSALSVISNNSGEKRCLDAHQPSGKPVRLMKGENDLSEAIFAAKEINRMVGGIDMLDSQKSDRNREKQQRDFSDIALLYRTHHQARILEKCLKQEGIPYVVVGRDEFLTDDAVVGTLAFFRFLLQPEDLLSLRTALELLWSCPKDLLNSVPAFFEKNASLPWKKRWKKMKEEFQDVGDLQEWIQLSELFLPKVHLKTKPKKLLEEWAAQKSMEELEPIQRFISASVFYPTLLDLFQAMILGQENDIVCHPEKNHTAGAVTLMTLHGAKGLEFPVVFLCGAKKGKIPFESVHYASDMEEERRLFYVGMTRAKQELILLTSEEPSEFLEEIPSKLLEPEEVHRSRRAWQNNQLSLF